MRGPWAASASSRLMTFWTGGVVAGTEPGAPGAPAGAPGAAVGPAGGVVCCGGGVLVAGNSVCQPMMMATDSTIATMKFFWSISANFYRRARKRRDRRNGVIALATPRRAAAEAMRRQPAAAQRAVARHGLGRIGRAGGFVAAGADEEIGE